MPTALEKAEERLQEEKIKADKRRLKRIYGYLDKAIAEAQAGDFHIDRSSQIAYEFGESIEKTIQDLEIVLDIKENTPQ